VLLPVFMGIEHLRETSTDPASVEILDLMMASARRGSQVVQQVLTFARGTTGERRLVDLPPIVGEVAAFGRETFPRSIDVVVDVPPALSPVLADSSQIHQVLLNLCVNARDAMPDGGTLTLRARHLTVDEQYARAMAGATPGRFVVLSVIDTGVGIAPEASARIFDPFYTTKAPGHGTGLGLSTVHGIVKSHGGFIDVYSKPGQGSRFSVYLPVADTGTAGAAPQASDAVSRGHGECILVADDEEAIRLLAARILDLDGYRAIAAVITDMMMPVMDGLSAIRVIRSEAPDLPIIAVSGLVSTSAELSELGAHVLLKPFDRAQLLALLRRVLADREK
jgi:two-component system cell cycle sensor histidine kinase/response regulator CckA